MALMITDDCIGCAACDEVCPNGAISQDGELFIIDPKKCTECEGFHDEPQCVPVCPVECIHKAA